MSTGELTKTKPKTQTELIESKINREAAGSLIVSSGGMAFKDMAEVMEFAKIMSVAGQAVPPHMRSQPGFCLAVCIQALEWRMSPFAVANKSYVVNDRICYESQLIHAVIEQRAPIKERLKHEFKGAGQQRTCRVWATAKGESVDSSYESPPFEQIQPKNSPLWKTKPDLQLFYNTSRDWARMYFPDVIMSVYSDDEMDRQSTGPRVSTLEDLTERLINAGDTPSEQTDSGQPENIEPAVQIDGPSLHDDFRDRLESCDSVEQAGELLTEFLAYSDDPEDHKMMNHAHGLKLKALNRRAASK